MGQSIELKIIVGMDRYDMLAMTRKFKHEFDLELHETKQVLANDARDHIANNLQLWSNQLGFTRTFFLLQIMQEEHELHEGGEDIQIHMTARD
jgi:hypothetical protein